MKDHRFTVILLSAIAVTDIMPNTITAARTRARIFFICVFLLKIFVKAGWL